MHTSECGKQSDKISKFSPTSWEKTIDAAQVWIGLEGPETSVSDYVLGLSGRPDNVGFHKACYAKFTQTKRLQYARSRLLKIAEQEKSPRKAARQRAEKSTRFVLPEKCIVCDKKTKCTTNKITKKRVPEKLSQVIFIFNCICFTMSRASDCWGARGIDPSF